jgi:hypothetical protein
MKKYVFITPGVFNWKSFFDSPEPENLDIQILNFGQYNSVEDALKDLIELNENVSKNPHGRPFSLQNEKTIPKSFWIIDSTNKKTLAS